VALKVVIVGAIMVILLIPTIHVSASQEEPEQTQTWIEEERKSGFYREVSESYTI